MALSPTSSRGSSGGSSSSSGMLAPVAVATQGNITLSGLQTIDGHALSAGDRVLVWQQTDNSQHGIYDASAGAWSRSSDAATLAAFADKLVAVVFGSKAYGAIFQEEGISYGYDPYFYAMPGGAGNFNAVDPANVNGSFQMGVRTLYLGGSQAGGGGLIWAPGGKAYGSQTGGGANAMWQVTEDGAERFGGIGTLGTSAPTDASIQTGQKAKWFDDTTAKPVERFKQRDAAGTLSSGIVESACPITSGALPTATLSSGTGAQLVVARAVESVTPFTGDGTNNAATCLVQISPDNVTYSTLDTLSIAAALNLTGVIALAVNLRVPAGWYVKLTAVHGTIGTTTYY